MLKSESQIDKVVLEELILTKFVELCRWGKDMGWDAPKLAVVLGAMAYRLYGPESDNSPLERYIDNPHGDNPLMKPV